MLIVCCYLVGALFYHDFIVNFYRHGVVNYDVDFIYALQEKSNYTLVMEPYQNPIAAVGDDGNEIITYLAAFRKVNDDPFMNFEEFETLPGLRNIIYQYGRYRRVVSGWSSFFTSVCAITSSYILYLLMYSGC